MDIEVFIGQIMVFPYTYAPMGFHLCDGAIIPIAQNQALFALIGNKFGGNGSSNFALPNLQGAEPQPGTGFYIALQGLFPPRD